MNYILPAITIMAALTGASFIVGSIRSYRKKNKLEREPFVETYNHGNGSTSTVFWGLINRPAAEKEKNNGFVKFLLGMLFIGLAIYIYFNM